MSATKISINFNYTQALLSLAWLLSTGIWQDTRIWIDDANWKDAP